MSIPPDLGGSSHIRARPPPRRGRCPGTGGDRVACSSRMVWHETQKEKEGDMDNVVSLLDQDIYSMSQADRLLDISSGTARRWVNGYERQGKYYDPLVRVSPTDSQMLTWGEFVEARLISEYRKQGVTVFRMRPAIMELRKRLGSKYPLAMAKTFLSAENCELVMEVQQETGLEPALRFVVSTGQGIFPSIEVHRFRQFADYSEGNDPAVRRLHLENNIVLDPKYASGEPTVIGRRLRVSAIAEAMAAGMDLDTVAKTWGIGKDVAKEALRCSRVA